MLRKDKVSLKCTTSEVGVFREGKARSKLKALRVELSQKKPTQDKFFEVEVLGKDKVDRIKAHS
jgi:hypothetical protein